MMRLDPYEIVDSADALHAFLLPASQSPANIGDHGGVLLGTSLILPIVTILDGSNVGGRTDAIGQ